MNNQFLKIAGTAILGVILLRWLLLHVLLECLGGMFGFEPDWYHSLGIALVTLFITRSNS